MYLLYKQFAAALSPVRFSAGCDGVSPAVYHQLWSLLDIAMFWHGYQLTAVILKINLKTGSL
ncbi:MAG: hypothetical protein ACI9C4_001942 [Paraglaciecola sp.]|jgi:hypothetical protein